MQHSDIRWVSWHLKSLATRLLVQQLVKANNKETSTCLHYWPFVRGIHLSQVDSPHKGPVMQKELNVMTSWCSTEIVLAHRWQRHRVYSMYDSQKYKKSTKSESLQEWHKHQHHWLQHSDSLWCNHWCHFGADSDDKIVTTITPQFDLNNLWIILN